MIPQRMMNRKLMIYGITTSAGTEVLSHGVNASKKGEEKIGIHNIKHKFISELFPCLFICLELL